MFVSGDPPQKSQRHGPLPLVGLTPAREPPILLRFEEGSRGVGFMAQMVYLHLECLAKPKPSADASRDRFDPVNAKAAMRVSQSGDPNMSRFPFGLPLSQGETSALKMTHTHTHIELSNAKITYGVISKALPREIAASGLGLSRTVNLDTMRGTHTPLKSTEQLVQFAETN